MFQKAGRSDGPLLTIRAGVQGRSKFCAISSEPESSQISIWAHAGDKREGARHLMTVPHAICAGHRHRQAWQRPAAL